MDQTQFFESSYRTKKELAVCFDHFIFVFLGYGLIFITMASIVTRIASTGEVSLRPKCDGVLETYEAATIMSASDVDDYLKVVLHNRGRKKPTTMCISGSNASPLLSGVRLHVQSLERFKSSS